MRLLFTLLLMAAAVAAAVLIANQPGHVAIFWQDRRIDAPVAVLIAAVIAAALILAALIWLLRRILGGPGAFLRRRRERRRRQGYRALTQGMVAVAAGDAEEAQKLAQGRRAPGRAAAHAAAVGAGGAAQWRRACRDTLLHGDAGAARDRVPGPAWPGDAGLEGRRRGHRAAARRARADATAAHALGAEQLAGAAGARREMARSGSDARRGDSAQGAAARRGPPPKRGALASACRRCVGAGPRQRGDAARDQGA